MAARAPILFLCTGNSARSIMAEAIANQLFGDRLQAVSAGSEPRPEPHPLALQTLRNAGLETDGLHSKGWERFAGDHLDLVITLCGSARDQCPVFDGAAATVHWGLPDPPAAVHPESAFEAVYETLVEAMEILVQGPAANRARRAEEAGRMIARRFAANVP